MRSSSAVSLYVRVHACTCVHMCVTPKANSKRRVHRMDIPDINGGKGRLKSWTLY